MAKFQIVNPATGSGLTLDSDSPRFAGLCLGLTGGGVTAEATKLAMKLQEILLALPVGGKKTIDFDYIDLMDRRQCGVAVITRLED